MINLFTIFIQTLYSISNKGLELINQSNTGKVFTLHLRHFSSWTCEWRLIGAIQMYDSRNDDVVHIFGCAVLTFLACVHACRDNQVLMANIYEKIYYFPLYFTDGTFPEGYEAFCNRCESAFTCISSLRNHMREKHSQICNANFRLYLCDDCFFISLNDYGAYKQHKEYHKLDLLYRCNTCWYLSPRQHGMNMHVRNRASCASNNITEVDTRAARIKKTGDLNMGVTSFLW